MLIATCMIRKALVLTSHHDHGIRAKMAGQLARVAPKPMVRTTQRTRPSPTEFAPTASIVIASTKAVTTIEASHRPSVCARDASPGDLVLGKTGIARDLPGEKLSRRRDGLRDFGLVFGDVARGRGGGSRSADNARFHLETAIARTDDRLAERIEDAEAPFWRHVRDALAERYP